MSLLFMEGFDHYGSGGDPAAQGKWASTTNATASTAISRTGGYSLRFNASNAAIVGKPLAASGGVVIGVAFNTTSAFGGANDWLQVREGAVTHLSLSISAGGLMSVKRGATVLATGTTVLVLNSWYYIEFKAVIDDTAGSYELRIDGITEPNCSASGTDTRNAGTTGQWDRIAFTTLSASSLANYIEDLYVCDTSGSIRNDFLGAVKIEPLLPQTGNGSNVGLTPSTGTDHGALVDELPPNTTDYNSGATVGLKDTYNLPSMAGTGAILGIQVNVYAAKTDAGLRKVAAVIRHGGVDYDGADKILATSFGYHTQMWAQTPVGSPADWTSADINALEAGMKITV